MNEQQKKDLTNQSVARLHQIRASLLDVDKKEEEALGNLTKSKKDTLDQRQAIEMDFLRLRTELYNERANVVCHLLNFGAMMPAVDDAEIKAIAKDIGLAGKLREKRQQKGGSNDMISKDWCGPCVECTTACLTCVTNACLTCVSNTCLHSVLG
jgi:hypothetical protein